MKKLLLIFLCAVILVSSGCSSNQKQVFEKQTKQSEIITQPQTDVPDSQKTPIQAQPTQIPDYYYGLLDDYVKDIVDIAVNLIKINPTETNYQNFEIEIPKKDTYTTSSADDLYEYMIAREDIWWLDSAGLHAKESSSYLGDCYTFTVYLNVSSFWNDRDENQRKIDELEKKVNEIVDLAKEYKTDWEKALFVYEYISQNTYYDYDSLERINNMTHTPDDFLIHTPYGCLVNGRAVCDGYAGAYSMILKRLGIECFSVYNLTHAWNCAKIDGEYSYFDVTFDDIDSDEVNDMMTYKYFGITKKEASFNHDFESTAFPLPECTSDQNSYYSHFDAKATKYSIYEFSKIARKQKSRRCISFKVTDKNEYEKTVYNLFEKDKWHSIDTLNKYKRIRYLTNDDFQTITIYKVE